MEWNEGSVLLAEDMNLIQLQQLHIIEESEAWSKENSIAIDELTNHWQGRFKKIQNVLDPTDPQDVVTKNYMENVQGSFIKANTTLKEETTQQATLAKQYAEKAQQSATTAKTAETNTKQSEANAKTSETNAKTSEINAKQSEVNALTSETKAKTSETNAKQSEVNALTSATNAKESEANAKTSETNAKEAEVNAKAYAEALTGGTRAIDITHGGTGATTAEEALENLGAVSKTNAVITSDKLEIHNNESVVRMNAYGDSAVLFRVNGDTSEEGSMLRLFDDYFSIRAGGYGNENKKYVTGNTSGSLSWDNKPICTLEISKGTNGYIRDTQTGFTIQWGHNTNQVNPGTVTFPRAFSTMYGTAITEVSSKTRATSINNTSTTGFSVNLSANDNFYWIALGIS